MINFDFIDKKKNLGRQRIKKFASSMKKAVLEIVNGEFALTNQSQFCVLDAEMSVDLKYCNVFIEFFEQDKKLQNKILDKLNTEDFKNGYKSDFMPLRIAIARKISQKMYLKYMPVVRFRKVAEEYYIINGLGHLKINNDLIDVDNLGSE